MGRWCCAKGCFSPPMREEKSSKSVSFKIECCSAELQYSEVSARKGRRPYRLSSPTRGIFPNNELFMVDTVFSRENNLEVLEQKFSVLPNFEKSDENHLVWRNTLELTPEQRNEFLKLKPIGLYLLIDSVKWDNSTPELTISCLLQKRVNKDANRFVNKMIDQINEYPQFFQRAYGKFKNMVFYVQAHSNTLEKRYTAMRIQQRLCTVLKHASDAKKLNWHFESLHESDKKPYIKFHIDVHLNANSFFMGIRLLKWEDSYPRILNPSLFGSPMNEIMELADLQKDINILDWKSGYGEYINEKSNQIGFSTVGFIPTRQPWRFDYCHPNYEPKNQYDSLILAPSMDKFLNMLNAESLNRIFIQTTSYVQNFDISEFLIEIKQFMDRCKKGCIIIFIVPVGEYSDLMVDLQFGMHPEKYRILVNLDYTELRNRRRLFKILKI